MSRLNFCVTLQENTRNNWQFYCIYFSPHPVIRAFPAFVSVLLRETVDCIAFLFLCQIVLQLRCESSCSRWIHFFFSWKRMWLNKWRGRYLRPDEHISPLFFAFIFFVFSNIFWLPTEFLYLFQLLTLHSQSRCMLQNIPQKKWVSLSCIKTMNNRISWLMALFVFSSSECMRYVVGLYHLLLCILSPVMNKMTHSAKGEVATIRDFMTIKSASSVDLFAF